VLCLCRVARLPVFTCRALGEILTPQKLAPVSALERILVAVPLIAVGAVIWRIERRGRDTETMPAMLASVVCVGLGVVLLLSATGGAVGSVTTEIADFYTAWTSGVADVRDFLAMLAYLPVLGLLVLSVPLIVIADLAEKEWAEAAVGFALYPVVLFMFLSGTASLGITPDPVSIVRDVTSWVT
jgi:hypothetical protein